MGGVLTRAILLKKSGYRQVEQDIATARFFSRYYLGHCGDQKQIFRATIPSDQNIQTLYKTVTAYRRGRRTLNKHSVKRDRWGNPKNNIHITHNKYFH